MSKNEANLSGLKFLETTQQKVKKAEKDITVSCKLHISDAKRFEEIAKAYGLSSHKVLKSFILNLIKEYDENLAV